MGSGAVTAADLVAALTRQIADFPSAGIQFKLLEPLSIAADQTTTLVLAPPGPLQVTAMQEDNELKVTKKIAAGAMIEYQGFMQFETGGVARNEPRVEIYSAAAKGGALLAEGKMEYG